MLAELAGDVHEGLLAMAVGTGLQVMAAMMNADVEAVCGPKGRHDPARTAVRHGTGDGSVTLGGRRVPVTRPRMRAADGTGELPVAAYELFSSTETVLGELLAAPLHDLDLIALMIDGVHFGEHLCVVALGIGRSSSASTAARRCWPRCCIGAVFSVEPWASPSGLGVIGLTHPCGDRGGEPVGQLVGHLADLVQLAAS